MSDGSNIQSDGRIAVSMGKIRSRNRRRLLNRLTDGGATVSEMATDSGIRIPHVSAEIRKMRNDALVDSDMPPGSRGAILHLTEKGWDMVRDDEWSRASEGFPLPDNDHEICILSRDGPNLLIGMMAPTESPLILIPDRPPVAVGSSEDSSGTEGVSWSWAVIKERAPRWFDVSTMESRNSPIPLDRGRIDTFSKGRSVIGIVRARLLDEGRPIAIAPGKWFAGPLHRPAPPLPENTLHRGPWVLGTCHNMSPDVRPKSAIAAVVSDRLPRSMLLKTSRSSAIVIANLGGVDIGGSEYPLEALDHWIEVAHPRLSDSERVKRCQSLKDRILGNRRSKTEDSTWRRFRQDWGQSRFFTETVTSGLLDTRGLGDAAIESMIRWVISIEEGPPIVVDFPDNAPSDVASTLSSHPSLRMVILNSDVPQFSNLDRLTIDPLRPLPWMTLEINGGRTLPVKLIDPVTHFPDSPNIPSSGRHENDLPPQVQILLHEVNDIEYSSMIRSASSQYPEGNEEWANRMEASYPIAAWIASPSRTRWPRWQRLGKRLDPKWLVLMDFEALPLERLSEAAEVAPEEVLEIFSVKFTELLRDSPDSALRARPTMDSRSASPGASWVASQLLANSPWLPESLHDDLLKWSVDAWLSNPPEKSLSALEGLSWLHGRGKSSASDYENVLNSVLERGRALGQENELRIWSNLVDRASKPSELEIGQIGAIINSLPLSWWSAISSDLLFQLLQEDDTTDWLLNNPVSWSAAVLRTPGEECKSPALHELKHKGCSPELRTLLDRRLRGARDGDEELHGTPHLLDLLDSLESVFEIRAPVSGRTHPLIGWLAQPLEKWPDFNTTECMSGDAHVAERLLLRESGFHEGFSSSSILG